MTDVASKVAVLGSGISGAVCASILAKNGISVTIFESARGPGGRMSHRRERCEDGSELSFDHGAPCFTVSDSNSDVQSLVNDWESRGFVAEWKEKFASFDFVSRKFVNIEEEGLNKRYVGVPGMNSICRALCHEPGKELHIHYSDSACTFLNIFFLLGVESRFGCGIGRLDWLDDDDAWSLTSLDGQDVGCFKGVVTSDKITFSSRFNFTFRHRRSYKRNSSFSLFRSYAGICSASFLSKWVQTPCDTRRCSNEFSKPLDRPDSMLHYGHTGSKIPMKGLSFMNSETLSWAYCDSSKPGRVTTSERWVLHSTAKYAELVISQTGFQKPSSAVLGKVAEELFQEFQRTGLDVSQPFFKKAHRWGAAFPAMSIAREEKCVWAEKKRLAICGDFCVMPNVEGAISSGIAAASNFIKVFGSE